MLKAGDILKFESSQYWFDEKYPEGRYIVTEDRKTEWNQDEFELKFGTAKTLTKQNCD